MTTKHRLPARFGARLASCLLASVVPLATAASAAAAASEPAPLPDLPLVRLDGTADRLGAHRGTVLLVVNTASQCGYTPQYDGLQQLHARFRDRGFSVLGFPSNDFGGQEPGTNDEIATFCRQNYGVTFPMYGKIAVTGADAHPLYRTLTSQPAPVGGPVKWNFQKYLVDRDGRARAMFPSTVRPDDPLLAAAIEGLLGPAR